MSNKSNNNNDFEKFNEKLDSTIETMEKEINIISQRIESYGKIKINDPEVNELEKQIKECEELIKQNNEEIDKFFSFSKMINIF